MNNPMHISFDVENYDSKAEMFDAITLLMEILLDNGYVCSVRFEDCGIYIVEFDSKDMPEFELWHKLDEDEDGE